MNQIIFVASATEIPSIVYEYATAWLVSGKLVSCPSKGCAICISLKGKYQRYLRWRRLKIGDRMSSEGMKNFNPSKRIHLIILIILAGDIDLKAGPRFQCRLCNKYYKASDKIIECGHFRKRFHAACTKLCDE